MPNYKPLFRNATTGKSDVLDPPDGAIIDIIDVSANNVAADFWDTLTNAGSCSLLGNYNGVATFGALGGTLALAGALTVAQTLGVTGNATFGGNVTLGDAAADDIIVTGQIASDLAFDPGAARAITIDNQNLSITTTTAGDLIINSVDGLDVDAGAASSISVTSAKLTLETLVAGDIDIQASTDLDIDATDIQIDASNAFDIVGAANSSMTVGAGADLTLGGRGANTTFNDAANLNLVGFLATTIIGALNELRDQLGNTTPEYNAGEAITKGDLVCMDWSGAEPRYYLADKDTSPSRSNPCGVALANAALGNPVRVATCGEVIINTLIVANNEGNPVFMDGGVGSEGKVTLTAPITGDSEIVGVVSKAGAAGTAQMIIKFTATGTV